MAGTRIVCLGCAFWDTILKVEGIPAGSGKIFAETAVQAAAGMATAAAVAVARLGGAVDLWTRIGDDPVGDLFLGDLAGEGVGTGGVRRIGGGRTWFSTILVDGRGERLVVAHRTPLDPDPAWLPLDDLAGVGAVLCDMRWTEGAKAAFAAARARGIPTVLDADVAPPEALWRMAGLAEHVLFSEPALAAVAGPGVPEAALRAVAAAIPASVIGVTLGADGAVLLERRGEVATLHRIAAPRVRAVDTLNAGDVWHGAYTLGLAHGWDLPRRVEVANCAAAMKCEHFGGRAGAPTLSDLVARLGFDPQIRPAATTLR